MVLIASQAARISLANHNIMGRLLGPLANMRILMIWHNSSLTTYPGGCEDYDPFSAGPGGGQPRPSAQDIPSNTVFIKACFTALLLHALQDGTQLSVSQRFGAHVHVSARQVLLCSTFSYSSAVTSAVGPCAGHPAWQRRD